MAEYSFDDEFLNEVARYRRERNKELRRKIARNIGAAAETVRTGQSAPAVFSRWAEKYDDTTMTPQQKLAAQQQVEGRIQGIVQDRAKQYQQRANEYLAALRAELGAAEAVMQASSGEARSRASTLLQSSRDILNNAQQEMANARDPDGRTNRIMKTITDNLGGEAVSKAAQLKALPPDELMRQLQAANPGAPPAMVQEQARMIMGTPEKELAKMYAGSGVSADLPANVAEMVVEEAFRMGTPAAQSMAMLSEAAAVAGTTPRQLAEAVDPAYARAFDKAEQQHGREMMGLSQMMGQSLDNIARAHRMVGSDKSQVNRLRDEIGKFRESLRRETPDFSQPRTRLVQELEGTVGEARQMAGAVPSTGVQAPAQGDPAEAAYKEVLDETDPLARAYKSLDYIENFPESSPAQEMKKAITGSDKYQSWKKARGYDGFDDKLVFREFRRETRRADKVRKDRFKRQVELNKDQGITPAVKDSPSSTVVSGAVSPTRSEEDPREPR